MEDVLDLYTQPADPRRPLVCFDETSKALHEHYRKPTPSQPGRVARYDYEYRRHGSCALFLLSAPLQGWRTVDVRARRTAVDCAQVLKELAEVHFPAAETIVLVCDNLNTHTPRSLYKAFDQATADRLAAHGSWLNMAEIELSKLGRQCLRRRMAAAEFVAEEVAAWCQAQNADPTPIRWRFTTADARIRLRHLYPSA